LSLDELLAWEPDESAVEKAEASLAAAQVDYQKAAAKNSLAGDQLTSAEVKLAQAQRTLDDAVEAYDNAYDPGRDWELGDRRLSSRLEAERESAADALASAQESLAVAQAAYNLEVAGVSDSGVASARSQVLNARVALENEIEGPDEDEIESARLQVEQQRVSVEQARLDLESAEQDLADAQLLAPVGGTVTEIDLVLGQMVNSGQTGVVLADLSTLEVEIGLDESDIAQVTEGQPAIVTLDAFDDVELQGVITHIAPTAEVQSGVVLYDVTVVLDATEIPLRVGMTADVEVVTESAVDVLTIPLKAVRSINGRTFVLRRLREGEEALALPQGGGLQSRGGAQPPQGMSEEDLQAMRSRIRDQLSVEGFTVAPVELGVMTDAYAEVLRGLEEGDVVLLSTLVAESGENDNPQPVFPMLRGRP
ncbi:MAG: HlyD family efflux transporter periplasmic adaptor subunit, partial [Anaerolineae bacterium]